MEVSFSYLALAALFGYAAVALFLWVAQRRIIFGKPTQLRSLLPGPIDSQHTVQPLRLAVNRMVQLEGWASRPLEAQQRKVLIYFGGRNEHVGWACGMPTYLGPWTIYAFNYRGFGQSGGRPSEATAKADALKIFDEVCRLEGNPCDEMVLVGRSLGTAMALAVAARRPVSRLVLLSPFESMLQLVRGRHFLYAMRWTLHQKFDCRGDAAQIQTKSALLLAEYDTRISHQNSLALAARLQGLVSITVVPDTNHRTLLRHPSTQTALATYLNSPR